MIEAGAAGVHFEDQLASEKKCGHMGGKVLVPTAQAIRNAGGGAAGGRRDGRAHLLVARTDANGATLLTTRRRRARPRASSPASARAEGFFRVRGGLDHGHRARPGLRAVRRPDLVRDVRAGPGRGAAASPRRSTPSSRASCWPTTARRRSTGRRSWTTATIAGFQRRAGRDGLQVPVHHPGRLPRAQPLDVRAGARLREQRHDGLRRAAGARVRRPRTTATRPPGTSARWAPATSTRWRRSSPAGESRPPR